LSSGQKHQALPQDSKPDSTGKRLALHKVSCSCGETGICRFFLSVSYFSLETQQPVETWSVQVGTYFTCLGVSPDLPVKGQNKSKAWCNSGVFHMVPGEDDQSVGSSGLQMW